MAGGWTWRATSYYYYKIAVYLLNTHVWSWYTIQALEIDNTEPNQHQKQHVILYKTIIQQESVANTSFSAE